MTDRQELFILIEKMIYSLTPEEQKKMVNFFNEVSIGLEYASAYRQQRIAQLRAAKRPKPHTAWEKFERAITLEWLF